MAKKGFTGSEIYIQDKFDEFDFWSRYNNMRPKEGFAQMWKDYKDSTQKEENQLVKIPPIPSSVLKSGLGFILKQLASGKFNQGKRDFLEKIVKPPKPKIKIESPKPFKFSDVGKGSKEYKKLEKEIAEIFSKHSTKHAEGGIAGMLGEPRSGYKDGGGGYQDYWTMVQDSFSEAGGQDGTGMNIQDFAEMYFPRKAEGGRIGMLAGGLLTSGIMNALRMVKNIGYAMKGRKGGIPWPGGDLYPKGFKSMISTNLEKALALKQQLKNNISGYKDILKSFKKEKVRKFEIEDARLGLKDAKEGLKKIDKYIEIQPKNLTKHAEGGRIGLADGMSPSERWMRDFFFSERGETYENRMSFKQFEIGPGVGLWNNHIGKAKGGRIGYDNGGPVSEDEEYELYKQEKEGSGEEPMDFKTWKIFKIEFPGLAQGGRIGFKEGEGIMSRVGDMVDVRNVPYYSGKGLQGLVNSAETLSKLPLAAGKLTSDLIQKQGFKKVPRETSDDEMTELFMQQTGQDYKLKPTDAWGEAWGEAIENITPGSWSENLGLTSLVEGMGEKRPKDAQTVGNILGLGTEVAVPTGGAFKAGQLLLSKASKLMGKVKDGKTLNKLVEDKISDSGQSRRDFMSLVGTGGLMAGLKWLGLGGILKGATKVKPSDDVVITLKTFIDDSDVMTEAGPVATSKFGGMFDIEGLSKAAQKTLEKIMKKLNAAKSGSDDLENPWRNSPESDLYEEIDLEWGTYILDGLKKAGHKVKLEHWDDTGGTGVDDLLDKFKNSSMYKGTKEGAEHYTKFSEKVKKMTERQKMEYHNSITDDYGSHYSPDVEEFFDDFYGVVKKAEGGRIGYDTGGLAGMLGERTGFPKGKRVRKQPKKPKPKAMTMEEAIEDINKKLKDPDITDDESRRLRIILHDLILGPGMGGPRGDKIYQSKEDLPEGILEMLQKDPAFDFEEFSEIEWSPEGLRWTDKGHPGEGTRGMAGPMGVWSGMAPFGETAYMDEGRGPRNKNIHMTDLDKAKIISHELRHDLMGDEGSPLHYTQPEWVKEYKGRSYLRSEDDKPIGTSGHELYNRFIDTRLFPGEEHPGPNEPYFDKILRDHWEPNFQQYKKAVKELKSKPEHLSAEGGRIGLQTGGPPITLQRPMFNDGGLTKTIPPERGPNPQGLPSALYNGIMRSRSY